MGELYSSYLNSIYKDVKSRCPFRTEGRVYSSEYLNKVQFLLQIVAEVTIVDKIIEIMARDGEVSIKHDCKNDINMLTNEHKKILIVLYRIDDENVTIDVKLDFTKKEFNNLNFVFKSNNLIDFFYNNGYTVEKNIYGSVIKNIKRPDYIEQDVLVKQEDKTKLIESIYLEIENFNID